MRPYFHNNPSEHWTCRCNYKCFFNCGCRQTALSILFISKCVSEGANPIQALDSPAQDECRPTLGRRLRRTLQHVSKSSSNYAAILARSSTFIKPSQSPKNNRCTEIKFYALFFLQYLLRSNNFTQRFTAGNTTGMYVCVCSNKGSFLLDFKQVLKF